MTATMLVLSLIRPAVHFSVNDPSSLEPEGVHGIPYPRVVEPAPLLVDGGAQLRGE